MLRKLCCLDTDQCKCGCFGLTRNKTVKLAYILLLLLGYLVLFLTNTLMHPASTDTTDNYRCLSQFSLNQQAKDDCVQDKNMQIVFSAIGVMHLIIMGCMFLKSQKVKVINEGIWFFKILVVGLVALFLRLVVASGFFQYLTYFSIWGANVLYIFMAIVFVDLVYALDATIDECAKQNKKLYILKAIISISILLTASFLCFLSFKHNPPWVCWTNAACLLVFLLLALLRVFTGNSIMVAASIGLCLNILGFYLDEDSGELNQYNTFLTIFKVLFLIFLLLGMLCQGSNMLRTRKSTLNQLLALNTTPSQQDNRYVSSNKWTVYHYVMMMIAITLPALFCWHGPAVQQQIRDWLWINKAVWWLSILICYLWSLIASKLFPEQDFSDLENYFRQYQLK